MTFSTKKFDNLLSLQFQIGSWSQWLSDIFSMDHVDSHVEPNEYSDNSKKDSDSSFRAFHLLNALSDLMMLPFEMLADRTTRKEVPFLQHQSLDSHWFHVPFCFINF